MLCDGGGGYHMVEGVGRAGLAVIAVLAGVFMGVGGSEYVFTRRPDTLLLVLRNWSLIIGGRESVGA